MWFSGCPGCNYDYGHAVFTDNDDATFLDNPYEPSSPEGRRWIDGFVAAMIEARVIHGRR